MFEAKNSCKKSVLETAKNSSNNMVGPDHPDFHDYGFVSPETNEFFQKYMERVTLPTPMPSTKMAKPIPGQRKSSSLKERNYTTSKARYNPDEERKIREAEEKKAKPKRAGQPPPMDFKTLLELAQKNSVKQEQIDNAPGIKKRSPQRLLTAREKLNQKEREQRQRNRMLQSKEPPKKNVPSMKPTETKMPTSKGPFLNAPPPKPHVNSEINSFNRAAAAAIFAKTNPGANRAVPAASSKSGSSKSSASIEQRCLIPKPAIKRNNARDDDESEYDSELDDFIDDSESQEDISSYIRGIFGYDKRKFRDVDNDDDKMESSFAQMQREEFISKKLGQKEDIEDMRLEALAKKKKMAKKAKQIKR